MNLWMKLQRARRVFVACGFLVYLVCQCVTQLRMFEYWTRSREMQVISDEVGLPVGYRSLQEVQGRSERFPSVTERLKVYLSTWYAPPCTKRIQYQYVNGSLVIQESSDSEPLLIEPSVEHSRHPFLQDDALTLECSNKFCDDVRDYLYPARERIRYNQTIPMLLQFGDAEQYRSLMPLEGKDKLYPDIPIIKKFRYSMSRDALDRATAAECYETPPHVPTVRDPSPRSQAIVSIVSNYDRHFGLLPQISDWDTPWEDKEDRAVWRGALTGKNKVTNRRKYKTDESLCQHIPRCNLVYRHAQSNLVDAKLVHSDTKRPYPIAPEMGGISVFGESMEIQELLRHKMVIMLEGNDVSSGLKWALFSNSVVLTMAPTCTSWAMEELLEPWVHYVPIREDFSDVEQKVEWVLTHDKEAQEIARRGRLWISDLVFHPEAFRETQEIQDETLRRYVAHFDSERPLMNLPSGLVASS